MSIVRVHVAFHEPTLCSLIPSAGICFPVWTNCWNYPAEVCWAFYLNGWVWSPCACLDSQMLTGNCRMQEVPGSCTSFTMRCLIKFAWSLPSAGQILTLPLEPVVSVQFLSIQHSHHTEPHGLCYLPFKVTVWRARPRTDLLGRL